MLRQPPLRWLLTLIDIEESPVNQQKKGLHPLAWVGIGCGVLVLIGVVVMVAGGMFVAKKVQDVAEDFEKNPALMTAKGIALVNPDIDLVDSNEADQTVTFKNVKTDEEFVISFEDIENGNLSWETSEGTFGIDASEVQDGGSVTFTGPDGETAQFGAGNAANIPDWVILPDSAYEAESSFSMTNNDVTTGAIAAKSPDSVDDVKAFYQKAMEDAGYEVSLTSMSSGGNRQEVISGTKEGGHRTLNAMVSQEGSEPVTVAVQYSGPAGN